MRKRHLKKFYLVLLIALMGACSVLVPEKSEYARLQRIPASLSESGLAELDKVLDQADSLEGFLQNQQLRENYYFGLVKYYGKGDRQSYNSEFKTYYDEILRSLSELTKDNPEASKRIWEKIESAEQKSFQVSGSLNSSGIALNAQNLQTQFLPALQNDLEEVALKAAQELYPGDEINSFSEIRAEKIQEIIDQVLLEFEQVSSLRKKEKGLAIKALKEGASMRLIQASFALKFLESPNVAEMIQTEDADIIMQALKRLPKVSMYADDVAGGAQLPGLFNISDTSWLPTLLEIEEHFEKARKLKREFELIASAGTDDGLIRQRNQEKRELLEKGTRENPLFHLETMEQAHNKKIILKQAGSGGKEVRVVALPRRFHAIFRAARHDECVRKQCAKWGSAFMKEAEFYFTETSNQKMSGYLQILPVRSKNSNEVYGALEVMTPSTGGEVIGLDSQGLKLKKTAKFDMMIDELSERLPENIQKLVISDGNTANNASGKNAVYNSKAYVLGDVIAERPGQLELVHDEVSEALPIGNSTKYSAEKFIGDGVNTDGSELRLLLPEIQRQGISYEEFLPQYLKQVLRKNSRSVESMKVRAKASDLILPDQETLKNWLEGKDLPFEKLSLEDTKEVLLINQTFFKWLEQSNYRPGENPEIDRWVNDTDFFQEILQMIKKNPGHKAAQIFYENASLRENFLNQGGRTLAAELILGDNRERERLLMDVIFHHISPEELLGGLEVKRAVSDWFFESANISSYSNLKKRKNFAKIEIFFNVNELFEDFQNRFLAGDYYQKRELLFVFSRSSIFNDLASPLIREWESILETKGMKEFLKEEIRAGVFGDFLTQVYKKSESLGTQESFKKGLAGAVAEVAKAEDLTLDSNLAYYLKREKVFKKMPELHSELMRGLRDSAQYQALFQNSLDKKLTLTDEVLSWAELFAAEPINTEKGARAYQKVMGEMISIPIKNSINLESFQRNTIEVNFSNLVKAMVEKSQPKELPAYMYSESFMTAFLDGLSKRDGGVSSDSSTVGFKLEQRIASSHNELPRFAQGLEAHSQSLYRFYQEHLEMATPSMKSDVVDHLNFLMTNNSTSGEGSLSLILQSKSFPGIKLLSESQPELIQQAFNHEKFIESIFGPYLFDFLSESQEASPKVRGPFFQRLEGTVLAERIQDELISTLFKKGQGDRAQALFKKPFFDLYSDKTIMAKQIVDASLEHDPGNVFKQIDFLSENLKADEFPYEVLNDQRFLDQVNSGIGDVDSRNSTPIIKSVKGETLDKLRSSEAYTYFLGKMLYQEDSLIKADEVLTYKSFFEQGSFYRGLFEGENFSEIEDSLKFLMKKNVAPLVNQTLMVEQLRNKAPFKDFLLRYLFASTPANRKLATSFINEFPAFGQDNPQLLEAIRTKMTIAKQGNQTHLLNMLKSKGGQTLLRQGDNRAFLLEGLKSSDLGDAQKQRFLKVLIDEADPSCQSMMGSFL